MLVCKLEENYSITLWREIAKEYHIFVCGHQNIHTNLNTYTCIIAKEYHIFVSGHQNIQTYLNTHACIMIFKDYCQVLSKTTCT